MTANWIARFLLIIYTCLHGAYAQCNSDSRPMLVGNTSYNSIFTSPNFPQNYPINSLCEWNITVPSFATHTTVRLDFNYFNTQAGADIARGYNGVSTMGNVIATMSGPSIPGCLISTGPAMYFKFTSDNAIVEFGFEAKVNTDPACNMGNRIITGTGTSILESPYFPTHYYDNGRCEWNFPNDGQSKEYRFTFHNDFNLEYEGVCSYDFVEITVDNISRGRSCGSFAPATRIINGFQAKVVFVSDLSVYFTGFRLTVDVIPLLPTEGIPSTTTPAITTAAPISGTKELTLSIIVNGTIESSQTISSDCNKQFNNYLKQSGFNMGRTVNGRLKRAEICDGDKWQLVKQAVSLSAFGNKAAVKYHFHMVGLTTRILDDNHDCSFEISSHLMEHINWEDPILPTLPGCGTTTFTPAHFDYVDNAWSCYFDPTLEQISD